MLECSQIWKLITGLQKKEKNCKKKKNPKTFQFNFSDINTQTNANFRLRFNVYVLML